MKILFVNEKCGQFGGVEVAVAQMAIGLAGRGHRCFLAYGERTGKGQETFEKAFERCFPVVDLKASEGESFSSVAERLSPDVIFVHKVQDTSFCGPWLSKCQVVRMIHDHDVCCPRRHKYKLLGGRVCGQRADWRCWALDGAMLRREANGLSLLSPGSFFAEMNRNKEFHGWLVGSRFMRDELLQNGFPLERVHVVAPVAQRSPLQPLPPSTEPNILFVGQLIRGKGVDLLLSALTRVQSDFTLSIVGSGNAETNLRRRTERMGLSGRTNFAGWAGREDMPAYFARARLVVVPSRWPEPYGLVGQEAMQYARPVVAFDVGGISDWLEHGVTGLLVREQDTSAMAEAIDDLLRHPDRAARMGQQGCETAGARFGFDAYIREIEQRIAPLASAAAV